MNEGQRLNFESGKSQAEAGQAWNVTETGSAVAPELIAGAAEAVGGAASVAEISKFATPGGAAETYREKAEQVATQNEMMERGVFAASAPEQDITGNGLVSDTEAALAQEAKLENQLGANLKFADKRLEQISEEGARDVERIIKSSEDDPAEMTTKMDDARWTFLLNFNRRRGDGYGGMAA